MGVTEQSGPIAEGPLYYQILVSSQFSRHSPAVHNVQVFAVLASLPTKADTTGPGQTRMPSLVVD